MLLAVVVPSALLLTLTPLAPARGEVRSSEPSVAASLAPGIGSRVLVQDPKPAKQSRRRRKAWQASLKLPTDLWQDVTAETIGETAEWTNKVELADIDGDGRVDILFANGGDYDKPGTAVPTRTQVCAVSPPAAIPGAAA